MARKDKPNTAKNTATETTVIIGDPLAGFVIRRQAGLPLPTARRRSSAYAAALSALESGDVIDDLSVAAANAFARAAKKLGRDIRREKTGETVRIHIV